MLIFKVIVIVTVIISYYIVIETTYPVRTLLLSEAYEQRSYEEVSHLVRLILANLLT